MRNTLLIFFICSSVISLAQKTSDNATFIHYTITVSDRDTTSFTVEMQIRNAPHSFQLAMVKHIEYDDRYWRYLKYLEGNAIIKRLDSALWLVNTTSKDVTLQYSFQMPATPVWRGSWKPFISSNGALIGGPHSFLYIVGQSKLPAHITINKPQQWNIATGLTSTLDPNVFYASNVEDLVDEPIMIGTFHNWKYTINGTPHLIAYQPKHHINWFDTTVMVNGIQKITEQAGKIFNGFPYRDYTFQILDESYGGLEHANSVTIGAGSDALREDMRELFAELAHEYFHTWNLVRIRPSAFGDVSYKNSPLAKELWWSEGATMFYQQIILLRSGLPMFEPTRTRHLEEYMSEYYTNAGNHMVSPVKVSEASNAEPGMLGDYSASTHLQGQLISTLLDLKIRSVTNNQKSLDDLMRWMMLHFGNGKRFTNADIEKGIQEVSGWDAHNFFQQHIYGNHELDFNTYLKEIGLHSTVSWIDAVNDDHSLRPDLKIYAWKNDKGKMIIGVNDPQSVWAKGGIHTGMEIISVNGQKITSQSLFFQIIRNVKLGDNVEMVIKQNDHSSPITKAIHVTGYKKAIVKIEELPMLSTKQKELYNSWSEGK
jgi:Predicted protease with the C-terminal PDZ domain